MSEQKNSEYPAACTEQAQISWPSEKFVHERIAKLMAEAGHPESMPLWTAFCQFERDLREGVYLAAPNSDDVRNQWISVDERLPKPETDVLIIRLGEIRLGAIFIEHESWEEGGREIHYWDDSNDDGQRWEWYEVTHWMPLTPAPNGNK